ncbi:MAG: radical SAM protein [Candidatus Hodarchaeales archaeon]
MINKEEKYQLNSLENEGYNPMMSIRVSLGSAIEMGLIDSDICTRPTTIYLLTTSKCTANCSFCSQARGREIDRLSRVSWPEFSFHDVLNALSNVTGIKRVCLQATNNKSIFSEILYIIQNIAKKVDIPISVSCPPMDNNQYLALKKNGVNMIGISLDGATPDIFDSIKGKGVNGPYHWNSHMKAMESALTVFGKGNVRCHLIIGLGETEQDAIELISDLESMGVKTSLFAFTPLRNTPLKDRSRPDLLSYRRIQVARYLINSGYLTAGKMTFDTEKKLVRIGISRKKLRSILHEGRIFQTSGCSGCNRPYYNDSPSKHKTGDFYNFPGDIDEELLSHLIDSVISLGEGDQ